jgi:hypothetical protein
MSIIDRWRGRRLILGEPPTERPKNQGRPIVNQFSKMRVLATLALSSIVLAVTSTIDAKVVRTTLDELVERSELVMYGATTTRQDDQAGRDEPIVWFKADTLLNLSQLCPPLELHWAEISPAWSAVTADCRSLRCTRTNRHAPGRVFDSADDMSARSSGVEKKRPMTQGADCPPGRGKTDSGYAGESSAGTLNGSETLTQQFQTSQPPEHDNHPRDG